MKKLNDLKKCEFALNMANAVLDMVEKENKKLKQYKGKAEKYIENLEQENHYLKIDNAQQTAALYKNIYPKLIKKKGVKGG